jgi:hypothetical protein
MTRSAREAPAVLALLAVCAAGPALAEEHIYSYEASSPAARVLAPTGLSFAFSRHLLGGAHVHRIIQTGEQGEASVKAVSDAVLGGGGLKAALAGARPVGDLYEIQPQGDGRAFIQAICPGAQRAWLVIGPLQRFRELRLQAIGKPAGAGAAHACVGLAFNFHSEWSLPPDRPPPPVRFPTNQP